VFEGERLHQHWRIATHLHYTSDEYAVALRAMFALAKLGTDVISDAIVTCVVPPLLPIFQRTSTKLFGCEPLVVGSGVRTGMPMRVDNPREVGADRIVNAVAAAESYGTPVIAIDFGTATSFDCVSAAGEFVGGVIFPGLLVSLEALVGRAAKLSSVEIERPPSAIGRNTAHCIQSGMLFGYAGLVDSLVGRLREELGAESAVVATGGLAHLVAAETKTIQRVEPFLTMQGLRLIFERNRDAAVRRARKPLEER
jgi:type III pantothenate kinase